MSDRGWSRIGAASGAAFVVLSLAGSGGGGPANDASRAEIGRFFSTAATTGGFTSAGPLVELVAMLALLVFWSHLSALLRHVEGDAGWLSRVVYGAGVGSVVLKVSSFPAAYALHTRSGKGVDPALVTALYDMNNAAFVLGWALSGLALLALAVGALRFRVLPGAIAYSAGVVGAALLVAVPFSNGVGIVAFLAFLLWLLTTSVTMVIRPASTGTAAADRSTTGPSLAYS